MRVLLILFLILLNPDLKEREVIVTKKVITVSGQTSIGGFNCDYAKNGLKDTLYIDYDKSGKDLIFDIPVNDFSCGNFLLNRDFRKTIKAEQFPTAKVKVRNLKSNYGHYTCDLSVDLVGKKLNFPALVLKRTPAGVSGYLVLSFEELALETPKKMGGLIKVEEELHLEIQLGF
ncbi:hypothetical protein SAMN00777080_3902 [Aquiflexum balticum DSM 16537]|uniref:YceI-like domain-containing protein n=1 Tax=Aquiflexum balticum DSM 16537 TaxID=758820 RepID=A0A1W2H8Z3_9BACT|nr:hypothetical protein [Aquiflexum balticum]SMD45254.1 hypothetical protein SAMN00777080_3902 [Aquiflexum balticum DSM 16537]